MKRSNSKQKAQSAFKKLGGVVLITATIFFTACKQTGGGTQEASFVKGGALLILSPDNLNIKVKAVTSDGSAITVEGCNETTLTSDVETTLHATGTRVVLKGKIIKLNCDGIYDNKQPLTALNVQGLTSLEKLECQYNQLTELNVQGLTSLQELTCYSNQLTELNVQGLTSLERLECQWNQLTELNVQGCASLQSLSCHDNRLTELNVQGLTSLQWLDCSDNKLPELNVQGLTSLQSLSCHDNRLTELNVQGLTKLENLWCHYNQLTELNVQGLTKLENLWCYYNQLTALNVQGCASLQELSCHDNRLTELNVQGLTALKRLFCYGNKLNAQAMTDLLNALPDHSAYVNVRAVLYTEKTDKTEGNCKDFTQPEDLKKAFDGAKSRNWKLQKENENGSSEDL